MDSVLTALKETPITTILVVAGIVFLLLSIAGQLAGRITVPPERQRQATMIGCLLVIAGVALHVVSPMLNPPEPAKVPGPTRPPPGAREDQPAPPPTTQPGPEPPAGAPEIAIPALKRCILTARRSPAPRLKSTSEPHACGHPTGLPKVGITLTPPSGPGPRIFPPLRLHTPWRADRRAG
jgi:hypothetical protein